MAVLAFDLDEPESRAARAQIERVVTEAARLLQAEGAPSQRAPELAPAIALLRSLDPGLSLEATRDEHGSPALLVARDGERPTLPLAGRVARALAERSSLPVLSRRVARPYAEVAAALARQGVDVAGVRVRAGLGRGHLVELAVTAPRGAADSAEARACVIEDAIRELLGEQLHDDWIGAVRVAAPRRGALPVVGGAREPATYPLAELGGLVRSAAAAVRAALPQAPRRRAAGSADWALLEVDADGPESDALPCADLVLASSCAPEAVRCFLGGGPFASARFSAVGETFAYVALPRGAASAQAALADRDVLGDAIDDALARGELGAVVGAGIGVERAYLFVALRELEASVPRVAAAARGRTGGWIGFCDDGWEGERVEVGG
ncbi:MAG: hypothetical protein IT376_15035 [Polyangiaceae bacterium]|nr:hypothetical protein [Polyangiaceae bacterium]